MRAGDVESRRTDAAEGSSVEPSAAPLPLPGASGVRTRVSEKKGQLSPEPRVYRSAEVACENSPAGRCKPKGYHRVTTRGLVCGLWKWVWIAAIWRSNWLRMPAIRCQSPRIATARPLAVGVRYRGMPDCFTASLGRTTTRLAASIGREGRCPLDCPRAARGRRPALRCCAGPSCPVIPLHLPRYLPYLRREIATSRPQGADTASFIMRASDDTICRRIRTTARDHFSALVRRAWRRLSLGPSPRGQRNRKGVCRIVRITGVEAAVCPGRHLGIGMAQ